MWGSRDEAQYGEQFALICFKEMLNELTFKSVEWADYQISQNHRMVFGWTLQIICPWAGHIPLELEGRNFTQMAVSSQAKLIPSSFSSKSDQGSSPLRILGFQECLLLLWLQVPSLHNPPCTLCCLSKSIREVVEQSGGPVLLTAIILEASVAWPCLTQGIHHYYSSWKSLEL